MDARDVNFWVQEIHKRLGGTLIPGGGALRAHIDAPLTGAGEVLAAVKLIDTLGASRALEFIQNRLRVSAMPYGYEISEGNVAGHAPFLQMGINTAVGTGRITVWPLDTLYTFPSTAGQQMEVVSSSANDTALGPGVRSVRIAYLDTAYSEQTTTVTLAGATPVPTTPTNIVRIQRMRALTVGTGGLAGVAAGNIDVRMIGGAATIYGRIATGYTRTRQLVWTVPSGKALHITDIVVASGSTAAARFVRQTLLASWDDLMQATIPFFEPYFETGTLNSGQVRTFVIPLTFGARTDIVMVSQADGAGGLANCAVRGWYENA